MGFYKLNKVLGYVVTGVVTADMIFSLYLLLAALPSHKQAPQDLLRSAAALWVTNILVFASWYWRLDAGDRGRVSCAAFIRTGRSCFRR